MAEASRLGSAWQRGTVGHKAALPAVATATAFPNLLLSWRSFLGLSSGRMSRKAVLSDPDDVSHARSRSAREMFARVGAYVYRYPGFAAATMLCAILTTLLGLVYPKLTQLIIDQVIVAGQHPLLLPYVVALAVAFIFRDLFNLLRIRLNNTFEQHVVFDMRCELYAKLQRLPVGYFDQRATGDIMTRLVDDVTSLERVLIDGLEQGTVALLAIGGISIMLFALNVELAAIAMAPLPFLALAAILYTRTAHRRYRFQRRAISAMNALLHDNLQGIRQIKAFARETHELSRFAGCSEELRRSTLDAMRAWSFYSPGTALFAAMGSVLILYFGGQKVITREISVGELVAFLGYLAMFYDPINRLHSLNQMIQAGRAAGERIFDILDAPDEVSEHPASRVLPARVRGAVRFEHVHFEYAANLTVLHDIDFEIAPGQTVALVGPTGAGKSTILNLLPRFYEVTRGCVRVDGADTREITLRSLREQMGIVSQEPFLFNGTIRENLLLGKLDASQDELIAATKAANAHEFIMRLPKGCESRVGERGVKLSVGEKQRISIARALLKDPPILLLDEATASVDTATERLIQEALARLMANRTCLMIAHRLSTIRHADVILVLERGRIIERGSHAELLGQGGLYARLCQIQTLATVDETLAEITGATAPV